MHKITSVHDVTTGISEAEALRKRYQKESFGLETGFEIRDLAEKRILELRKTYNLAEHDVRLVKHISSAETGHRITWEVYVRDGKGVDVLFTVSQTVTKLPEKLDMSFSKPSYPTR